MQTEYLILKAGMKGTEGLYGAKGFFIILVKNFFIGLILKQLYWYFQGENKMKLEIAALLPE